MAEPPVYADPTPYDNPDLERFMIAGRIKMQATMLRIYEENGNAARAARTRQIIDQLLDRYATADDMAALAARDLEGGQRG